MKVAIASCYYHHNYGSMLQALATQDVIKKMGCEVVTIQCSSPMQFMTQSRIIYYFHKLANPDIVNKKVRQRKGMLNERKYQSIRAEIAKRSKCFDDFSEKYFNISEPNRNRADLVKLSSEMNAVVVGSDMLWHPINVEHDYYTLTFVPDTVKKISYATSFGTTEIPLYQVKKYKQFLTRFDAISVRETSGLDVIRTLKIQKDAQVVLDPTLLFTGEEWKYIQKDNPIIRGDYILCYFLGTNRRHRDFANTLKKVTGLKIVALQHLDEFVEEDITFGDIKPFEIGPGDFVNLIRNAKYICTDSFHGTCFSILNHKNFFTMNRFDEQNSQSTNTRIDSLLGQLGLQTRRVFGSPDDPAMQKLAMQNIDYSIVDEKLKELRKSSIQYLKSALGVADD